MIARPNRFWAAAVTLVLAATPAAWAQVTTDDSALSALKPATPAAPSAASTDTAAPVAAKKSPVHHKTTHAAPMVAPPTMPRVAPANPVILPPTFVMPAHPAPPPPAVPLKPDALGSATATPTGQRLVFGPDSADLNPAMLAGLQAIAAQLQANPALTLSITAFAPGVPQDPSPARRLSLSRALACRAALIHAGIVSDRLYARAQGFNGIGTDPADRADLVILGATK